MSDERWAKIPGASAFSVSTHGRVRRDVRLHNYKPGLLKGNRTHHGYDRYCFKTDAGTNRSVFVHTVVLEAFVGPRPEGQVCRHLDGDSTNNALSNLAYGTYTENVHDAIRHGTQVRGERVFGSRLTEPEAREIKWRYIEGESFWELAAEFGVAKASVWNLLTGRAWWHVDPAGDVRRFRKAMDALRALDGLQDEVAYLRKQYPDLESASVIRVTDETRKTVSGRPERIWIAL